MYQVHQLDHVSLQTERPDELVEFYVNVIGLRVGSRPGFRFPGAWLYCGSQAVVHIIGVAPGMKAVASEERLRLEHFAFQASGLATFLARLEQHNVPHRDGAVRDVGVFQVNINDPDGNHIHVDFKLGEALTLGLTSTD